MNPNYCNDIIIIKIKQNGKEKLVYFLILKNVRENL